MPTLDDVSRIAATLPGSEERAMTGGRAWFVRSRLYAWECHPWPSIEPEMREIIASETVVAVKVADEMDRLALVQGWPDVFLPRTARWGEPKAAFRLARIDPQHLAELLTDAWYTQAPKYLQREFEAAQR